jgi:hypothetical protein
MTKRWWESKTLWVNVLTLLALILGTVAQWPELQHLAPHLLGALSVVNIALRFVTDSKLVS